MSETRVGHAEAEVLYHRPAGLTDVQMRYCPGCTHGTAHKLIAEVVEELDILERTVAVATVGCSVYAYEYFNTDAVQAAHGRGPAVATGIKRASPESIVFTYQGDGDLAAIGLSEVIHSAQRGEKITVIFLNNAVFGMTRGQMAPTTLVGQRTTTTPLGRDPALSGMPMMICEMLSAIPGVAYLARETMIDPKTVRSAKRSIRKAFQSQIDGVGFSLVELLSTCPVWWHKQPLEAMQWIRDEMLPQYPLSVFVDYDG
jgi:2-oxoglutarate/2-oxoacid ferredoxin oxidoreductase subunit beta